MNKKEAREHLIFIKRAIKDLGYDCMDDFEAIKEAYKGNAFQTNQELYNATSKMMCRARYSKLG